MATGANACEVTKRSILAIAPDGIWTRGCCQNSFEERRGVRDEGLSYMVRLHEFNITQSTINRPAVLLRITGLGDTMDEIKECALVSKNEIRFMLQLS